MGAEPVAQGRGLGTTLLRHASNGDRSVAWVEPCCAHVWAATMMRELSSGIISEVRVAFGRVRAADQAGVGGGFRRWRWITWVWAACGVSWLAYLGVWNATVGHKTATGSNVSSAFLIVFVALAIAWWMTLPGAGARAARALAGRYADRADEHPNYERALDDDLPSDELHSHYGHLIGAHRREMASKLNQKPWLLYLETKCPSCNALAFRECYEPAALPDAVHTTRPGALYAPVRVRPQRAASRRSGRPVYVRADDRGRTTRRQ